MSKSVEQKSDEDPTPRALLAPGGVIVQCNDAFASVSRTNSRFLINSNITDLAKFSDPEALLEAAFKLDQLVDPHSGIDCWRAPLSLGPTRKAEDGASISTQNFEEEYTIVVCRSTQKYKGQVALEAVLHPLAAFTPSSKSHGRFQYSSKMSDDHEKDSPATSPQPHGARPFSPIMSPSRTPAPPAFTEEVAEPKNLRVLIVEDSPTSLKLMSRMITRLGHEVSSATNGRDALELLKKESFDIVLMDINMPLMNGLQASHEFRKLETQNRRGGKHRQKIIAMSGDISNTLFHEVTNAGFDAFIPKPLTEERFHEVLRMPISDNK